MHPYIYMYTADLPLLLILCLLVYLMLFESLTLPCMFSRAFFVFILPFFPSELNDMKNVKKKSMENWVFEFAPF